ncbi:MAG: cation:proton antiporter [Abditibacteriota bacterium]|nr:cation:proton antiporter [Abditibacteriota bacterium]
MTLILALVTLLAGKAFASGGDASAQVHHILLGLIVIIVAAKLGGDLFVRLGQPAVLGELVFGIIIGNLGLFNVHIFEFVAKDVNIAVLSEIGVIFLLFQVGLESDIAKMAKVGASAFVSATVGVIVPFLLGWAAAAFFIRDEGMYAQMFIGATLCATSVGITARVLMDLGKVHTKEARIILGAAVIDDVQGLIVLAVISGLVKAASGGAALSPVSIILIIVKAVVFLGVVLAFGRSFAKRVFALASHLRSDNIMLCIALVFCFGLAYIAAVMGLAAIVGAFAAGLVLDEVQWRDIRKFRAMSVDNLIAPIAGMLVPIFFVRMGATVDITSFGKVSVLVFAAVLTVCAVIGKQACGLGVVDKGVNRLVVGLGMIPRGEVGLIFAATGMTLMLDGKPVIGPGTYSAIVIMVVVTTVVTPPLLKWALTRAEAGGANGAETKEAEHEA